VIQFMFMNPQPAAVETPHPQRAMAQAATALCLTSALAVALAPGWVLGWLPGGP
jgi:hypothetical protein